jgi:membrane-bound ClpP family serine protease
MRKKIKRRKTNAVAIILGVITIVVSLTVANYIYRQRLIRMNGQLLSVPLVKISYSGKGGNSGYVEIDGELLHISSLDRKWGIGDSIKVRYVKGETMVVQEKKKNWNFILYFGLDSVLLIIGLLLVYAGIRGKGH